MFPPTHSTVKVIIAEMEVVELISPQKSESSSKNGGDGVVGNPIKVHIPVREPSLFGSPSSEIQIPISYRVAAFEARTTVALKVTVSPGNAQPSSRTVISLTLAISTSLAVQPRLLLLSCRNLVSTHILFVLM